MFLSYDRINGVRTVGESIKGVRQSGLRTRGQRARGMKPSNYLYQIPETNLKTNGQRRTGDRMIGSMTPVVCFFVVLCKLMNI